MSSIFGGLARSDPDPAVHYEDPAFLAKMFSAMDQVLLAHWVEGGMKTDRADLVRRLAAMVERAFGRG